MAKNADIGNIYRFSIKNRPSGIHQLQTRGLKQPIFCKYGQESWQMLNIYCMWFMKCCKIWLEVTFAIKRGNQSIYRAIQNTFYFYNISKHMPMTAAGVFGVWHLIGGSEEVKTITKAENSHPFSKQAETFCTSMIGQFLLFT